MVTFCQKCDCSDRFKTGESGEFLCRTDKGKEQINDDNEQQGEIYNGNQWIEKSELNLN